MMGDDGARTEAVLTPLWPDEESAEHGGACQMADKNIRPTDQKQLLRVWR